MELCMQNGAKVIVVVPVYEDVDSATILFARLSEILGKSVAIVAVDDGSVTSPLKNIEQRIDKTVIHLRRNVGHQQAIAIGLSFVHENRHNYDYVVVMDSDGEDMPESVPSLVESIERNNTDIVVASRRNRNESIQFRWFYQFYKLVFSLLVGRRIGFGNFMVMTPSALDRLVTMPELKTHLAACVLLSKLRIFWEPTDRGQRYAGSSKMNFVSLALHGFRAIMVFAENALVRVGLFCTAMLSIVTFLGIVAIGLKLAGLATPGWLSVVLGILGVLFLQFGVLTLMSLMNLMLTGMIRSGFVAGNSYRDSIKNVE